jgi:hypothetical protein
VVGGVEDKADSAGDLVLEHAPDAREVSIDPIVEEHVDEGATVQTDAFPPYRGFGERTGLTHEMENLSAAEEPAHEVFPWIHVVWGNLKHVLGGVHTKASRAQLQGYLDLFAYRFNSRAWLAEGLDRALRGLVRVGAVPRRGLRGGEMAEVY